MADNYLVKDGAGASKTIAAKEKNSVLYPKRITVGYDVFRDSCESFTPAEKWVLSKSANDIFQVDGNTAGSSYYDLSLDPLSAGTETTLTSVQEFSSPAEVAVGLSLSQRTLGQEFSLEFIDSVDTIAAAADVAISSIQQTTTTLTITTSTAHGLFAGRSFGVRDCADSRFNYPSLVVAAIVSPTQFTATAGPAGTIPSITAGPFTSGFIYTRRRMGLAANGSSMIFENAVATNAAFYICSDSGGHLPSGNAAGNQDITIATTAPVQAVNAPYAYSFQPTSEYRLSMQQDRVQWVDVAADSSAQSTPRVNRTQVVPNPNKKYKIRFRATNNKGLTVPVAKIVAVAKTGTTTATVTTNVAHGLTTGDLIAAYGVRDTTNFANLTTATAVASVVDATNFTVIWGSAVTASSQSGIIYRVNGGNLPSALGVIGQVVQSVVRTANVVTLTGSATWAGFSVGDYVNLAGCYDTAGVSMGLDGTYRIRTAATTALELEPIASGPTGTDITSTNCGGVVIKRTSLRIHYVRAFDYENQEWVNRPAGDIAKAIAVAIQNIPAVTLSSGTLTTCSTVTSVSAVVNAGTPAVPATPIIINSAASTNGQLILTGTSGLHALYATNIGATAAFVKLYNKATAPTVGTDTPAMIIPVPAAVSGVPGVATLPIGFAGFRFALGLGLAITGAVADSDTTAVAAGQVKVIGSRTV